VVESLWAAKEHGLNRPVVEQMPYSLLERELLPMARTYGIGGAVWSPVSGGVLTGKYRDRGSPDGVRLARDRDTDWDTKHFGSRSRRRRRRRRGSRPGEGLHAHALSLAWLLTREGVSRVVLGARNPAQLLEQLEPVSLSLSEEDKTRLDVIAPPGRAAVPYYLDDSFADLRPHAHRW
jgi:aryl-alcohol dehydrogenase-like predicted oxidoreductase